jgi:cytochrome c oxidase assembly factor CtaG
MARDNAKGHAQIERVFFSLFLFWAVMVQQVPGASRLNDFKNLTLIGKGSPRAVARRAPAVLHSIAGSLLHHRNGTQ